MDSKTQILKTATLFNKSLKACGYQKLVIDGASAQALTVPTEASYAEIRLESDVTSSIPVRYLMLGATTPPTTTDGLALNHLDFFDVPDGDNLRNLRFIEASNGVHTLHIQYYK